MSARAVDRDGLGDLKRSEGARVESIDLAAGCGLVVGGRPCGAWRVSRAVAGVGTGARAPAAQGLGAGVGGQAQAPPAEDHRRKSSSQATVRARAPKRN